MSASVEDRIVAMKMDNTQFERGIAQSLSSLQKLEATLNKGMTTKGLDGVSNNLRGFNLNPMESALSGISKSWLAMSTVAVTALAQVTSAVFSTGANMVKSLSLDPVIGGFTEYSTNLNAIQTTLANTQAAGTTLDDVNGALQQLNNYSDKTIYNFGEMAKNIGTFTAAGVSLEGSVDSIKGIANLAALSGSSSEQASTAMYQLSQAIAAGRVSLQDWNSVVNAGMGGSTFQQALAQTAVAMGTIDESAVKIEKSTGKMTVNGDSFRDSISAIGGEKWLTSDVLTSTLSQFTGDLTDAQLAAQGFNKAQIAAIQQTAKTAEDAATKVKTIKQVFDVAKETVGSGWSLTFMRIFGDFEQARTTFTQLSNFLNGIIKSNSNARNKILKDWGDLGGRTKVISAVSNAWKALMSVLGPIKDAFRDIFPAKTGEQLFQMSKNLNEFFRNMRLGKETQENLKRSFAGFFAVLDIGWQILKGIIGVFADLFGVAGEGASGFLEFTGSIGDWLVALDEAIKKGDGLTKFFSGLSSVLAVPIRIIQTLAGLFANLFTGTSGDGAASAIGQVTAAFSPFEKILHLVATAWNHLMGMLAGAGHILQPIIDAFSGLGTAIAESIQTGDFSGVLDAINTGLFAGIVLLLRNFVKHGLTLNIGKGGAFSSITNSLDALSGSLQAMQANIQADTLLKIAGAITLIAASVVALSLINSKDLTKALTAMSVGFAQLLGAMKIMTMVSQEAGMIKMPLMAASMVLMASAILILSGAVAVMAQLSWEDLLKGLSGVIVLMAGLAGAANLMGQSSGPMLRAGAAMLPLAIALNILAGAMKLMATMTWEEMAKGMVGIAGGLVIIAGAMQIMPATLPLTAAGLVLVAVALNGIATSMMLFATLSWQEIGKGMVGIAGGLVIIAGAMQLMPVSLPITAAGLVLVAIALNGIAAAAKVFATMSWEEMGKAAAALAGALLIIAGGMALMSGALPGAAALVVVAGALAILTPVLIALGAMSWESIIKGLVTLAGVFVVLGLAGLVLAPLVPVILALGAAIALIGVGVGLAGAGVLALSAGSAALVAVGTAGIALFIAGIEAFLNIIPDIAIALAEGLTAMIVELGKDAPQMINAFVSIGSAMLDGMTKLLPKFGKFISKLIETGLKVIVSYYSDLAEAGVQLIENLLDAVTDAIPDIADKAGNLIAAFIKAIGKQAVKLANAAADALVDFLNGLADAIETHSTQINNAGARVAVAFIAGVTQPLRNAGQQILDAIQGALNWAKDHVKLPHFSVGDIVGSHRGRVDVVGQMVEKLGLVGGSDQIKEAFDVINAQLDDQLSKSAEKIQEDTDKLKKLRKAGKGDSKEAKALAAELKEQTKLHDALVAEKKRWNKSMKDERGNLLALGKQYDTLVGKIKDAQDALDDITKKRDDIANKFNSTPDITSGMSLTSYLRQIQKKTTQTQKFMETLQSLRALGLDDASYQQLLNEGVDAQRLMDQLLSGGSAAVMNFNGLNAQLSSASVTLANQAAQELYHTGVAAAQGLLDGLNAQVPALEEQMNILARAMVKAMKKALKMKSPSRAFMEIGDYSAQGVVLGLEGGINAVEKASEKVGLASLETLKATMNKASKMANLDLSPVIAPVLDLTQLQKEATKISTMLATDPIVANVSYENASDISSAQQANLDAAAASSQSEAPTVKFEQTINSPEALDDVKIYRNTKNLMSIAKEALKV